LKISKHSKGIYDKKIKTSGIARKNSSKAIAKMLF